MLCMSVFSILQQHCCGVLFFINNSVVQHAELNVTAPDAVLHWHSAAGAATGICSHTTESIIIQLQ